MSKVRVNAESHTLLPNYLVSAHNLCFLNHDVLVELLRSGEEAGIFSQKFAFSDEVDRQQFEAADDVFTWFENTGRTAERSEVLKRIVFPALLSDFLHFIYEALESSRKAKLNVAYALIRKPIQENLFLLEVIAADPDGFARYLIENPLKLRAGRAGGLGVHAARIAVVLKAIGEEDRFDAKYLAQLRYDKNEDGFDGICNHAVHLFTEHEAIRTEPLNINFIFSGSDEKVTQWYYLYSRLPYILFYARRLVEHVCATFAVTDQAYLANVERRLMAATLLWAPNIEPTYCHPAIDKFVEATRLRLTQEYVEAGYGELDPEFLSYMQESGEFPARSY